MPVIAVKGTGEINMPIGEHAILGAGPDGPEPGETFWLAHYPAVNFIAISIVHGVLRGRVSVEDYDRIAKAPLMRGVAA